MFGAYFMIYVTPDFVAAYIMLAISFILSLHKVTLVVILILRMPFDFIEHRNHLHEQSWKHEAVVLNITTTRSVYCHSYLQTFPWFCLPHDRPYSRLL